MRRGQTRPVDYFGFHNASAAARFLIYLQHFAAGKTGGMAGMRLDEKTSGIFRALLGVPLRLSSSTGTTLHGFETRPSDRLNAFNHACYANLQTPPNTVALSEIRPQSQ